MNAEYDTSSCNPRKYHGAFAGFWGIAEHHRHRHHQDGDFGPQPGGPRHHRVLGPLIDLRGLVADQGHQTVRLVLVEGRPTGSVRGLGDGVPFLAGDDLVGVVGSAHAAVLADAPEVHAHERDHRDGKDHHV
jgi:hypothetical protein